MQVKAYPGNCIQRILNSPIQEFNITIDTFNTIVFVSLCCKQVSAGALLAGSAAMPAGMDCARRSVCPAAGAREARSPSLHQDEQAPQGALP
jgi:hypothetical protein